jgi:AraC-like DNA-binding protein
VGTSGREHAAALRPFVRSLNHYDIDGFPPGQHIGMPSAAITLVVALDPPLDLTMAGAPRRTMAGCLAGMHDGPATIHHQGVQRGLHASLTPLGLERLLGVPASALSGVAIGLEDVFGTRAADSLLDRIWSAADWPNRRRAFAAVLVRELERTDVRRAPRPEVARAWSLLTRSGGAVPIADIATDVGWSPRHLQHQFAAAVGLTPKRVSRIVRFERSIALIRRGCDLADALCARRRARKCSRPASGRCVTISG